MRHNLHLHLTNRKESHTEEERAIAACEVFQYIENQVPRVNKMEAWTLLKAGVPLTDEAMKLITG